MKIKTIKTLMNSGFAATLTMALQWVWIPSAKAYFNGETGVTIIPIYAVYYIFYFFFFIIGIGIIELIEIKNK